MLSLMPDPLNNGNAALRNLHEAEAKAQAMIVLNLGPAAKVRCCEFIVDLDADERTAFQLCSFLTTEYTATNALEIHDVRNLFDSLKNLHGKSWDSRVDKFK